MDTTLTSEQQRVLGALVEKRITTPDHYPLSTNALVAACNQSSSRDPIVDYDEDTVIDAVNELRRLELARTVKRTGERAIKHLDLIESGLDIDERQASLLAVLLLRGAQTPGELRTRTARYHEFELEDVETTLESMATADIPTVELLPRQPGEREARWRHLLGDVAAPAQSPTPEVPLPAAPPVEPVRDLASEVDELREAMAGLRSDLDELRRQLGAE